MLILIIFIVFDLKECLSLLEKARGEKPKRNIKVETIKREEIDKYVEEAIRDTYKEGIENFEKILIFFNLMQENGSYIQKAKELYREQAAAFYNPKDRTLKLIKDVDDENIIIKSALVHELMHALQDEKINIYREMENRIKSYDSLMALQSFLEGEALLITFISMSDINPESEEELKILKENSLSIFENFEEFLPVENFLTYEMVLPYKAGFKFVMSYFEKEKWRGVENLYKNLPCTMEEILHFDKKNSPAKDFSKFEKKIKIKDYKLIDRGTFGESFLYYIFSLHNSKEESKKMAEGWDGDKLLLFEKGDEKVILWLINWDREEDFQEALKGFKNYAAKENIKILPLQSKKSSIFLFYKGEKPVLNSNIFNILKEMEVANVYKCKSK